MTAQLEIAIPASQASEGAERTTPFDWQARLDNWTDCSWVLAHRGDYPDAAIAAAECFLEIWPALKAKELAHNFAHLIEAHHREEGTRG